MGGSSSKASTTITTELVSKAITRNISNCTSNQTLTQTIKVRGDGNIVKNVVQAQATKLSLDCAQDASNMTKMQQEVAAAIKQAAESQSVALLGVLGNSDSEVNTKIENLVKNDLTQETISNIILQTNLDQGIDVDGSYNLVQNVDQSQLSDMIAKNVQKVVNSMEGITKISNEVEQAAKSTQKNPISQMIRAWGDAVKGIMGAFQGPIMWLFLLIAVVAIAYFWMGGSIPGMGGPLPGAGKPLPIGQKKMEPVQWATPIEAKKTAPPISPSGYESYY